MKNHSLIYQFAGSMKSNIRQSYFLICFFLAFIGAIFSQPCVKNQGEPFLIATKMPQFPGGTDSMIVFIQNNLDYPLAEKSHNIQGTITVQFIVECDGSLSDIKTVKSVPNGENLNKEAERVVKLMPLWIPGEQDKAKVRVYKSVPFYFVLAQRRKPTNH